MKTFYLRNPKTAVIASSDRIIAFRDGRTAICLRRRIEDLYRMIVLLRDPKTLDEIAAQTSLPTYEITKILEMLVQQEIVLSGSEDVVKAVMPHRFILPARFMCKNLVMGISGSTQAANIMNIVSVLRGTFAETVEVVLTESATRFLRPEVVSYFGVNVWTDSFETRGEINVPHIYLASRAELVFILPATAHTIHRLATGACSDLLSLVVAATRAPVVLAPTMNHEMFASPAIQRNVSSLRADGFYIIEPGLGGEVSNTSDGHLRFCGIGITEMGVVQMLKAVLDLHQRQGPSLESHQLRVSDGGIATEDLVSTGSCVSDRGGAAEFASGQSEDDGSAKHSTPSA